MVSRGTIRPRRVKHALVRKTDYIALIVPQDPGPGSAFDSAHDGSECHPGPNQLHAILVPNLLPGASLDQRALHENLVRNLYIVATILQSVELDIASGGHRHYGALAAISRGSCCAA
jgi:hypothetical protein